MLCMPDASAVCQRDIIQHNLGLLGEETEIGKRAINTDTEQCLLTAEITGSPPSAVSSQKILFF